MKICRFDDDRVGVVRDGLVHDVSAALDALPAVRWPVPPGDLLITHLEALRPEMEDLARRTEGRPVDEVRIRSPVANPGKIIGAPVNYAKHLEEARADAEIHHGRDIKTIDHYGLFLKATSALAGPSDGVALRFTERRNDHEGELCVIIGRTTANVTPAEAMDAVAGYAVGLDMTVRGTEDRSLRKSIDTYAVVGPWLVTADEIADPGVLDITLGVNGELRQQSNTRHLIFDIPRLIAYASSFYTLHPGDILMTGTPEGVGPVEPGDVIVAEVEKVGRLEVTVRRA